MKSDLANYKEMRGTLVKKRRTLFGKHIFYINDGVNTIPVVIGKVAFDHYNAGMQLTIGYIGRKTINIRAGIAENDDYHLSSDTSKEEQN